MIKKQILFSIIFQILYTVSQVLIFDEGEGREGELKIKCVIKFFLRGEEEEKEGRFECF